MPPYTARNDSDLERTQQSRASKQYYVYHTDKTPFHRVIIETCIYFIRPLSFANAGSVSVPPLKTSHCSARRS